MKHRKTIIFSTFVLLTAGVYFLITSPWHQKVDFNTEVRPILNKNCIICHGGVKRQADFSLLFREDALLPSESGLPAIVPGKPEESELIRRIKHHDPEERMPLEAEPLSQEEIDILTRWIEEGAEWEDHWAFVKPQPVEPPQVDSDWIENDIDQFVLARLEEEKFQPSPEADKATLLRRVSLDLTGLPPTLEEYEAFILDTTAAAYEKVVNRLLASPHYGERWTSMWLDLARYADSKGYEKDDYRNIWKYRDWVINAFNQDMPYDQFTIEQLAGDLLPNPTEDQLIATAFHRNTMNNDEGGTDNEEYRIAAVIDRVNTTWEVWQATTMSCVQCHSHPYDPIRNEEYYKFMAFLNNTADVDVPSESPTLKIFTEENDHQQLKNIEKWVVDHSASNQEQQKQEKVEYYSRLIKITEPKIHPENFDLVEKGSLNAGVEIGVDDGGYARAKNIHLPGKSALLVKYSSDHAHGKVEIRADSLKGPLLGTLVTQGKKGKSIASVDFSPVSGNHDLYFVFKNPGVEGRVCNIEWLLFYDPLPGKAQPGYTDVQQTFLSLLNTDKTIRTPILTEKQESNARKTHILDRGNWLVHGQQVAAGVPVSWNDLPEKEGDYNRLDMARWLVSDDNPLTARVMVNRLWTRLFGTGIVETEEDFGTQGFAPSHPALLDWLALQFSQQYDWSMKKLLKLMVMSATYQQSSKVTPELLEKDPANHLLARGPRVRFTAEQVRDQALAVSGLLSEKMYGPSVMPPQPEGIWQVVYSGKKWETSEGEDQYRRALYTYIRRTSPYPSMLSFDAPSREFCVTRRIRTNTPLQALVTMNDPVYMEAARALANKMIEKGEDAQSMIQEGYQRALLKEADEETLATLEELYQESVRYYELFPEEISEMAGTEDATLAAMTVVANAIMNLDEFVTKV